jgi:RHS repeat-associated protein
VDNSGAILSQLLLDSFGRPLQNSNPAITSQLAFTSREFVPISGDVYLRARLYNPQTGRFLQDDPLQPFTYNYANNSPLVFKDPLGLAAAPEYGIVGRLVSFVVENAICDAITNVITIAIVGDTSVGAFGLLQALYYGTSLTNSQGLATLLSLSPGLACSLYF